MTDKNKLPLTNKPRLATSKPFTELVAINNLPIDSNKQSSEVTASTYLYQLANPPKTAVAEIINLVGHQQAVYGRW